VTAIDGCVSIARDDDCLTGWSLTIIDRTPRACGVAIGPPRRKTKDEVLTMADTKPSAAHPDSSQPAAVTEPVTPTLPTGTEDLRARRLDRIAARAREIYEARGSEHGQDLDDWLQAEREIDSAIEMEERAGDAEDDADDA
jgi:Protein of unknown function (DUF2934)